MPKPLQNVDWEFVKALFLQGFTQSQVAAKTGLKPGAIKSRAYREGWSLIRSKTQSQLDDTLKPGIAQSQALAYSRQSNALAKASQQAQETLSSELATQVNVLQRSPPKRLLDLANTPAREGRASVVHKLVTTAAKLYGWDAQSTQPQALNLTQVNVTSTDDLPANVKVIDVPAD